VNSANSLTSPVLPPSKFHSGLLQPLNLAFGYGGHHVDDDSDDVSMEDAFSDEEVSAPSNLDYSYSPIPHNYDEEQLFGSKPQGQGRSGILKTGLANQNLTIQVPYSVRRFTDGGVGFNKYVQRKLTPVGGAAQIQKKGHLRNVNCPDETVGLLGTPSAPPIIDADFSIERDSENSVKNEPTDRSSWPSGESVDFDGTKSESSIEQKPNTVTKTTEPAERCCNFYLHSLQRSQFFFLLSLF